MNKLGDLDSLFVVLVLDQVFVVIVLVVQVNSSQRAKNRKNCIKNTKYESIKKKKIHYLGVFNSRFVAKVLDQVVFVVIVLVVQVELFWVAE